MNDSKINLTSSESGALWTGYMDDSMSKQILGFMLQHIEDQEIKEVVQYAPDLTDTHQDVNMIAPWLFTDIFCSTYVNHITRAGMVAYSGFLATSYREDICEYFLKGLNETGDLYKQSLNIALNKGVNARHPYIEIPK